MKNTLEKEQKSFGYLIHLLPQVFKQFGCDYFFTQKLSWNNINKFPLTTFWWTGIDNSKVLAYLTPADTYNAPVTPSELYKCTQNHHVIEYSNKSILVFGGPTSEHLERLKRMKNVDGMPLCKPCQVIDFFRSVENNSQKLQSYKGELYLEFHLARVLENNKANSPYDYPSNDIKRLWKLICLNQFYDCLPGSGIGLAYVDVHKYHPQDYILFGDANHKDIQSNEGIAVFNTLPWFRSDVVSVPQKNTAWLNQQKKDNHELILVENVPGFSVSAITSSSVSIVKSDSRAQAYQLESGDFVLENPKIKAVFNARGQLFELYDKKYDRGNLVPDGSKGNLLQLYEDVPTYWDAWDGQHQFKYAIYPIMVISSHPTWSRRLWNYTYLCHIVKQIICFLPELILPSMFTINPPGRIIIDTVKLAEEDQGQGKCLILRLYEAYGGQCKGDLTSSLDIKSIQVSNILEDDSNQVLMMDKNDAFRLTLFPFQIMTLKVQLV
ncbi:glycosyl hydrolases family 38 N-terminal domain-containing protein [Chlamydoabsidia padenii]|nr:glycosyl hydrolases family 38 N-terminal domain-containing protein [Chlamydoabsidia padenii]